MWQCVRVPVRDRHTPALQKHVQGLHRAWMQCMRVVCLLLDDGRYEWRDEPRHRRHVTGPRPIAWRSYAISPFRLSTRPSCRSLGIALWPQLCDKSSAGNQWCRAIRTFELLFRSTLAGQLCHCGSFRVFGEFSIIDQSHIALRSCPSIPNLVATRGSVKPKFKDTCRLDVWLKPCAKLRASHILQHVVGREWSRRLALRHVAECRYCQVFGPQASVFATSMATSLVGASGR
jgi:hypothetical protein